MSSTNKTSNYELSQFIGADKPAWLSDYNTDMSKIDAQMKLNADGVTTASGSATTANTNIGTLANLTTDAKTNIVAAVNEIDSHADTASETASSALSSASAASSAVTALEAYLNMTSITSYTGSQFTVTAGNGTITSGDTIYVARNAGGTLCKIYGTIGVSSSTAGTNTTIKLNVDTGLRPTEAITVVGTGIVTSFGDATQSSIVNTLNIKINVDGTLEFTGLHAGPSFYYKPLACMIFVKNFGDTQQE